MAEQDTLERTAHLGPPIGGVVSQISQTKLQSGQYAMLRNLELSDDVGAFRIRKGSKQAYTTSLGAGPIRGIFRWYRGSPITAETVFVWNGDLYRLADPPVLLSGSFASWTTTHDADFVAYEDRLYFTSGAGLIRWDGTTMKQAGFQAPSSVTLADGGAGVLTGVYTYAYTATYDSDPTHESSIGSTSQINVTSRQVNVDVAPIVGPGAPTGYNLYRSKANGTTLYYRSAITPGGTPDLVDNMADTALDTTRVAPDDNRQPPNAKFAIFYRGRLVLGNMIDYLGVRRPNRIALSSTSSTERAPIGTVSVHGAGVEIFPADHWIDIGDDNREITGLAVSGDNIVVFKEHEIYLCRVDSSSEIRVQRTGSATGCIAFRTIQNMGDLGIFFLGRGGSTPMVYSFRGFKAEPVAEVIEPTLRSQVIGIGPSFTVQPSATRYRDKYILSYANSATPTYEMAVYDPTQNRWSFNSNVAPSCWVVYDAAVDAGETYFGSALAAWVVQWDVFGGDFKAATPSTPDPQQLYIESGWLPQGQPHMTKQAKWIYIDAEVESPSGATITVERKFDFETATGTVVGANVVAMDPTITGRFLYEARFESQQASSTTPEQGNYVKYIIKVDVAYGTPSAAYKSVKIHDIVVVQEELPPTLHRVP